MHTGRMSRMRTSFASLLWARPATRRACSSGVRAGSGPFFAASLAAVEAELLDLGGHRRRHQIVDWLALRDSLAHLAGRDRDGLEPEEADALRALEPLEHAVEPLARVARTGAHRDRSELEDAVRVFPVQEVRELVGADQEHRIVEAAVSEHVDGALVLVELDAPVGEGHAREAKPVLGVEPDLLVAGTLSDEDDEIVERPPELLHARAGRTRQGEDAQDPRILDGELGHLRHEIDLVQDDDLRALLEAGPVLGELAVDRPELLLRVAGRQVDHVHEQARALEVREELVAEADALARALDEARHVGDGELAAIGRVDRSEHRRERREGIVGDLGPRVRDAGQERRLAGVGEPDERRVGEELQPQLEPELLAREPGLREPRRLARRRREAAVAAPARAALREKRARARGGAGDDETALLLEDLRPDRDAQLDVLPVGAVLLPAASGRAVAGLEPLLAREAGEVAPVGIGDDGHVAAAASVAAVGPALGHVLLPAEAQPAMAAAARLNANLRSVVEHRLRAYCGGTWRSRASPSWPAGSKPRWSAHSCAPRASSASRGRRRRPSKRGKRVREDRTKWSSSATTTCSERASSSRLLGDADEAALAASPELHVAVSQREDRVVAAETRARAGAEPRAPLAHDDRPGAHLLAGEDLHAEHLRVGVAPFARRAESLLMRHPSPPSSSSRPACAPAPPSASPRPSPSASRPPSASPPRPSSAPPSSRRSTRSRSATGRPGSRCAAGSPSSAGTCRS